MGDLPRVEVDVEHDNERVSSMFGCKGHQRKFQELLAIPGLWNQVYAALALSLAGFLAGTVEGWPGAISLELSRLENTEELKRICNDLEVGPSEISIIFVLMVLSAMVHMMITGALLDRYGRRVGCWFLNFLAPSGWVFLITARSRPQLYIGAALIGTVGLSGENVGVIFLSEVTDEKLRGPLISLLMFFNSLGIFSSHILIAEIDFQSFHMFCLGVTLIFPFVFWRLPESPAYLMKKLRVEDARESVSWYHGNKSEVIEVEMQKLKDAAIINLDGCRSIFGDQSNRRAMTIIVGLFILIELTGTSMVEVFAGTTISMVKLPNVKTMSAKTASLILAACRFFGGLLNVYFVERSGRKSTLTLSLWIMAFFMGIIFLFLIGTQVIYTTPSIPSVPHSVTNEPNQAVSIYIKSSFYILFLCFSLYTLANQMFLGTTEVFSGELLTTDTKGAVMALAGFIRILTLVVCVAAYNATLQLDSLGTWSFFVYSTFCGMGAIMAYRLVPETQGKTLNEIRCELEKPGNNTGQA